MQYSVWISPGDCTLYHIVCGLSTYGIKVHVRKMSNPPKLTFGHSTALPLICSGHTDVHLAMTMLTQVTTISGHSTFFVAATTFPNSAYYDKKAESNSSHQAVLFVAKPPTTSVVRCRVQGHHSVKTDVTIDAESGG